MRESERSANAPLETRPLVFSVKRLLLLVVVVVLLLLLLAGWVAMDGSADAGGQEDIGVQVGWTLFYTNT